MKINQIINETTTAGSVATVSKPLGEVQSRTQVAGLQPAEKVMKGSAKKRGPYANSLTEGAVKQLSMDLKELKDEEFKKKYKMTKQEARKNLSAKPEPVQEAKLEEDDIIQIPGRGSKRKTGFVPRGQSRVDHEVEMARSDVLATMKNAKAIYQLLKDRSEDEGLEGWVQEKLIKANDYLNAVKEYYDEKMMEEMTAGTIAGGIAAEGQEERGQNRLWAQISDYEKRAKATSNDIKKAHYMKMASELRGKLKTNDLGEGAKVDRMVKHIEKSEKKLGHSKDEAENIAWATANKRGMLDNKNKKKAK